MDLNNRKEKIIHLPLGRTYSKSESERQNRRPSRNSTFNKKKKSEK